MAIRNAISLDDRIVVFNGPRDLTGRIMEVEIEKVDAFTLFGRPT